jgi:predicted transposase YdaD
MIEFLFFAIVVGLAGLIVYRIFFVHETVAQVESDIMTGLKGVETKVEEVVQEVKAEVEQVKVKTRKARAKAKAIKKVIEDKEEQLEAAVKKAKSNG